MRPRASLDRYLALFSRVFAAQWVPAWSANVGRRLVKSPKVLMSDPGLAASLQGVTQQRMVTDSNLLGPMLETFVGTELQKQIAFTPERYELMHYRDGQGHEVDWVLEDGRGRLVGVEVKTTTSPDARDFRGLRAFSEVAGDRFHRGIVLHTGSGAVAMGDRLWALPVDALWGIADS